MRGQRALMSSAGLRLRQGGAQGMVYPSARVDSEVQVHRGAVVESVGWNFVDYRDGGPPEMTHIIDMDSAWPTKVGFWFANEPEGPYQLAYEDMQIEYATRGANKGSWSVSGLATWQEAWFRASSALSVLEAKDPELFDEIGPILNAIWLQFASGKELLEVSDLVFGVLLEDAQDLNTASAWAEALATDGHQEISEAVQKLVDRAS